METPRLAPSSLGAVTATPQPSITVPRPRQVQLTVWNYTGTATDLRPGWIDMTGELKSLRELPPNGPGCHTERSYEGNSFGVVRGEAGTWVGGYRIIRRTPAEAFQPRALVINTGGSGDLQLQCIHGSDEDEFLGALVPNQLLVRHSD